MYIDLFMEKIMLSSLCEQLQQCDRTQRHYWQETMKLYSQSVSLLHLNIFYEAFIAIFINRGCAQKAFEETPFEVLFSF